MLVAVCCLQVMTDKGFWHGMQRTVQSRQHRGGKGKTYLYRFAVDSPTQNHYRIRHLGPDIRGVCHADEISYLFKNIFNDMPARGTMEFAAIERFVSLGFCVSRCASPQTLLLLPGFRFHFFRHRRQPER